MLQTRVDEGERPCINCPGTAEAEMDGEYQYYECVLCGDTFGHTRVMVADETCAIGVPEDLRKRASEPFEQAQRKEFDLAVIRRGDAGSGVVTEEVH